mmetsp:Transcript_15512/g.15481  ORF Transcript_15512/g.15481 Transcript_15512/m.15481 type:complete len:99 (-) Transcript_15512:132-428(-)
MNSSRKEDTQCYFKILEHKCKYLIYYLKQIQVYKYKNLQKKKAAYFSGIPSIYHFCTLYSPLCLHRYNYHMVGKTYYCYAVGDLNCKCNFEFLYYMKH